MPPALATLLTVVAVLFLLIRDARTGEARSPALWLPVLWLGIAGSRFVSQWLSLGEPYSDQYAEGSLLDAIYFATLIAAAAGVLLQRGVMMGQFIRSNPWLAALMLYGFLSIAWSDFPFVAFKRWFKTLGHPLMALIILTDPSPTAALRTVLKRCAFFFLPVSVLFVKYLPEYGRSFDAWSGEAVNNGVSLTKNDLGYLCMTSGIFFVWNLLTTNRFQDSKVRRNEIALSVAFLAMAFWLLAVSNSATSLVTMIIGISLLVLLASPLVSKRFIGTYVVIALTTIAALQLSFGLYEQVVLMLGRDPNLTDRTVVWEDVLALQDQPIFGFGFESFWLGDRLEWMWTKWWWKPNQAHNGYIETYLNLGAIGLVLLVCLLLSTFRRIGKQLQTDFELARLKFAFLFVIIIFNYTEATFKGVHFVWTIFYIIAMDYPKRHRMEEPFAYGAHHERARI